MRCVHDEARQSKLITVITLRVMRMWALRVSRTVAVAAFMGMIGIAQIPARAANTLAGEVTVPQSALNSLIGEPDRHFHRAADLYAKGDADGAASEIRAAAALIRMEAGRGSVQDAAKLQAGRPISARSPTML